MFCNFVDFVTFSPEKYLEDVLLLQCNAVQLFVCCSSMCKQSSFPNMFSASIVEISEMVFRQIASRLVDDTIKLGKSLTYMFTMRTKR